MDYQIEVIRNGHQFRHIALHLQKPVKRSVLFTANRYDTEEEARIACNAFLVQEGHVAPVQTKKSTLEPTKSVARDVMEYVSFRISGPLEVPYIQLRFRTNGKQWMFKYSLNKHGILLAVDKVLQIAKANNINLQREALIDKTKTWLTQSEYNPEELLNPVQATPVRLPRSSSIPITAALPHLVHANKPEFKYYRVPANGEFRAFQLRHAGEVVATFTAMKYETEFAAKHAMEMYIQPVKGVLLKPYENSPTGLRDINLTIRNNKSGGQTPYLMVREPVNLSYSFRLYGVEGAVDRMIVELKEYGRVINKQALVDNINNWLLKRGIDHRGKPLGSGESDVTQKPISRKEQRARMVACTQEQRA